jgi:hypothetical protein
MLTIEVCDITSNCMTVSNNLISLTVFHSSAVTDLKKAYDSFRREVLYGILIHFFVTMKQFC